MARPLVGYCSTKPVTESIGRTSVSPFDHFRGDEEYNTQPSSLNHDFDAPQLPPQRKSFSIHGDGGIVGYSRYPLYRQLHKSDCLRPGNATELDYTSINQVQPNDLRSTPQLTPSPSESVPLIRTRKTRRPKPYISLAPDQPPTTQGKSRARVYLACTQCRARKIRCDGARPSCHNCSSRNSINDQCTYDAIPKRRGPDKTPRGRQHAAREGVLVVDEPVTQRRRRRSTNPQADYSRQAALDSNVLVSEREQSEECSPASANHEKKKPLPLDTAYERSFVVQPVATMGIQCTCHGSLACPDLIDPRLPIKSNFPFIVNDAGRQQFDSQAYLTAILNIQTGNISELDRNGNESRSPGFFSQPSANFSRKVWWDSLLSLYTSLQGGQSTHLTLAQRDTAAHGITDNIHFLFKASNYWFSFFHIPTFFGSYYDTIKREWIQPCLILAMLAISIFLQSSEIELGKVGRDRALRFRDEAQAALEASFNAGWIDETLAQAAWLLAFFEVCAHPGHSTERTISSMTNLDSIIKCLSLTVVDANDPTTTTFISGSVPVVPELQMQSGIWFPKPLQSNAYQDQRTVGCSCSSLTLIQHWSSAAEHTPMWALTPAWNLDWTEAEIRKESCRRLCWSSIILIAGNTSYNIANRKHAILDLFIGDPANYALLFSGELVARSPSLHTSHSSKDTIWALHDRAFLLWSVCVKMRRNVTIDDHIKGEFAVKAWLEADALEATLNRHNCGIERAFIYLAREYIFNTRMCISHEFQRFVPLVTADMNGMFHRGKAEEWLIHQFSVAQRLAQGLHAVTGNKNNFLARRPFFVFWFMAQVSRALYLWQCDNTLSVALDVCKALLLPIDYLTALWPCPEQRMRYQILRKQLDNAFCLAGVSLPPPPSLSITESLV